MFYIIETNEQLAQFRGYDISDSFIEPILCSDNIHPAISPVCAYFIKPNRSKRGFILPISHSETFSLSQEEIVALFEDKVARVYVSDAKRTKYSLQLDKPTICLKTLKWLEDGSVLDDRKYNTPAHSFLYSKYPEKEDINKIVPISKHQEKWNAYITDNKKLLSSKIQGKKYFKFYNEVVNDTLWEVEKNGIPVDNIALKLHYPEVSQLVLLPGDKVYTHYNINTATGRPSNAYGGINFGAMNKSDDSRSFIIPENDFLVEFDYHSYHPKMLSNLVEYEFEGDDIHSHLGRMYFDTEELADQQYSDSKNLTFKILYTNAEEYSHIEFFRKVKVYKEKLWKEYREKGYLEAILSKRPITGIDSKTQILPYLLQSYETERNIMIMSMINEYLIERSTRFIMYNYDSFLFDWDKKEPEVLDDIQHILETDGYKTSVKVGKNYANLKELTD